MDLIIPWNSTYEDYLSDESRSTGSAESISFPKTEAEVIEIVNAVRAQGLSLTTQGARTGITAGAVPNGGHVMNLQRMNAIGEIHRDDQAGVTTITVQPGVLLQDLRPLVDAAGLSFPPDPTETSASLGGMAACNASGAASYHYGPTRQWIRSLRIVLSDGSVLALARDLQHAAGRTFSLTTSTGRVISGSLPDYTQPPIKSAAGYYVTDDMDLLDLFIGMEGTLGIITEIELLLISRPAAVMGLTAFLPDEEAALRYVRTLRGEVDAGAAIQSARPVSIEFFDHASLDLLRRMKAESSAFEKIPALPANVHTAVYAEYHAEDADALDEVMMESLEAIEQLGGDGDATWCATTAHELESLRAFRHATPEAVNLLIGQRKRNTPGLTKLGTDMSVPDSELEAVMAMYRQALDVAGLESVIFGHIGNNHLHVNILPNSIGDYTQGKALYLCWAQEIVARGGSISAEHGIGKLKVPFLHLMYGEEGVKQMQQLKRLFDPQLMLNPGNLFISYTH